MASSPAEKPPASAAQSSPSTPIENECTARLTRSAGAVSVGVMGSRVLGLAREMVLAYFFRPGLELDAFNAAYRIPNLLRDLFAEGALSKAFVSTFSEADQRHGPQASNHLASQVLNALLVVVGALTLLGMLASDSLVDVMFFGAGFDLALPAGEGYGLATKRELTVQLTRIMFPFLLLVSVAAIAMGVLNARGRFLVPAWASAFFNLGSIGVGIAGYFLAPGMGYHPAAGMALGVVAGGALQLLWQLPSLFRSGYRYRATLSLSDPGLGRVLRLVGPGVLASATVQVNVFINSIFASLGAGWLSWINVSFRLMHLPIGLVGVAVSMASLPALSRHAARGEVEGFRETFSHAIRLIVLFTLPAAVGLITLAEPIIRLLYQRGRFGAYDTEQAAAALTFYAIGLTGYAAVKVVTDGFYALQDLRAPLKVSVLTMVANAALNWFLISGLGMDHRGLALSTSCTVTLSFVVLWVLLRRRGGMRGLGGRATALMTCKVAIASAVMGAAAWLTSQSFERWLGHELLTAQLAQVFVSIAVAVPVLYAACRLLKVREMDQALRALWPARLAFDDSEVR
jgi:putative peptidoglycan lipid II flippase